MFQLLHGLKELKSRDVAEHSLGVPIPIEDSSVGDFGPDGILTIDFVIFQLQIAAARNVDGCTFSDLDGFLNGGAALLGGYNFFIGVDQVVVVFHSENSFVGGLDLEVAVPGGSFGILDIEDPKAGLLEIGFQDLLSLTLVDTTQLETLAELR